MHDLDLWNETRLNVNMLIIKPTYDFSFKGNRNSLLSVIIGKMIMYEILKFCWFKWLIKETRVMTYIIANYVIRWLTHTQKPIFTHMHCISSKNSDFGTLMNIMLHLKKDVVEFFCLYFKHVKNYFSSWTSQRNLVLLSYLSIYID